VIACGPCSCMVLKPRPSGRGFFLLLAGLALLAESVEEDSAEEDRAADDVLIK
jgi:hypothetical protein